MPRFTLYLFSTPDVPYFLSSLTGLYWLINLNPVMTPDLKLRRKWTFRAHGRRVVFIKKALESDVHVVMKALLWALYLPEYPDLSIEIHIGNRFKPDLVQLDDNSEPVFWGEAGRVSSKKMHTLIKRFRSTHMVFAKWDMNLEPFERTLKKASSAIQRSALIDLISFSADSNDRFIQPDGTIQIDFKDVDRLRF